MEGFELYVLDKYFVSLCLVDAFESMIWTDRYGECGDFELYLSAASNVLVYANHGNYIWTKGSDRLMIIEQTEITTDNENGNHLKITGRSLESILDRRIIWNQVTVSGSVQSVVKKLITDQIISPALSARRISNFVFIDSSDSYIANCEIEEVQYLGENLYDVIVDILAQFHIGFSIIYNFTSGNFEFRLYYGTDRSYNQSLLPWVIFSPEFDNIISSDFTESSSQAKNVNLVAGEEPDDIKDYSNSEDLYIVGEIVKYEGSYYKCIVRITHHEEFDPSKWELLSSKPIPARKFVYVYDDSDISGLNRKEMYTDGSSKQQQYTDENDNEVKLTDAQYISVLKEYGMEELYKTENRFRKIFDGEMNTLRGFKYGEDFFLGDIVQMENEYGLGAPARVTELIMSQDTSGISMYPTFEAINEGDE